MGGHGVVSEVSGGGGGGGKWRRQKFLEKIHHCRQW